MDRRDPRREREDALEDAAAALRLLADPGRLAVAGALAATERGLDADALASSTGLGLREVTRAVARLASAGLVADERRGAVRLRRDVLADLARRAAPDDAAVDHGTGDRDAERVLRTFLVDGRLVALPAQRAKRLVVLDWVARAFEVGRQVPEVEVNAVLRVWTEDYTSLRRALVDEGFLSREAGVYWRSGGTVEL